MLSLLGAALAAVGTVCGLAASPSSADSASTPFGAVDVAAQTTGNDVVVAGWAIDPNTVSRSEEQTYEDRAATTNVRGDGSGTDVASAFPAFGDAHGFSTTLTLSSTGSHTIVVYVMVRRRPGSTLFPYTTLFRSASTPFGAVDVAAQTTGNDVVVAGWAIDPNTVS